MVPVAFGSSSGWLVEPPTGGPRLDRGAVIVPAFGFEALCTRRALRILSDRLAAAGLPTLRYDPTGTGNALPAPAEADLLPLWQADLAAAIAHLKALTGVNEVVLIGLRLGALIAAAHVAAAQDGPVAGVALLAPPLSGKSYLRESAVLARIIAPEEAPPAAGVAVGGFSLNAATVEAIKALAWPQAIAAPRCLIATPGDGRGALGPRFAAGGTAVSDIAFAGYERMICDPTASEAPTAVLAEIAAWAREGAAPATAAARMAPQVARLAGDTFTEEAIAFGAGGTLAGILCRPTGPTQRLVIMTNAGGQPQGSWANMQVAFARDLATEGVASLRMDLSGHGDSGEEADPPTPFYYDGALQRDLAAGLALAEAQGFTDITVAGHCSGAHHAFHLALADARVRRLVLTNLQCFVWGPRYSLPLGAWMTSMPSRIDRQKRAADDTLGDAARWRARLASRVITFTRARAKPVVKALVGLAGRFSRATEAETQVSQGFKTLVQRGVRIALCYSEGDPGLAELALYMGPDGAAALALPGVSRTVLPGADHVLSQPQARRQMYALLRDVVVEDKRKAA